MCEAEADGRRLRLDASGLGGTTDAMAEKLIGPCNGVASLAKPICTVDVAFTPTGSGFEAVVTIIKTSEIEVTAPRRRRPGGCSSGAHRRAAAQGHPSPDPRRAHERTRNRQANR